MSGMLTSRRIRSGGSARTACNAKRPLGTGRARKPRRFSMSASMCRLAVVSSTTRMLGHTRSGDGFSRMVLLGPETVDDALVVEAAHQSSQLFGGCRHGGGQIADQLQRAVVFCGNRRGSKLVEQLRRNVGQTLAAA